MGRSQWSNPASTNLTNFLVLFSTPLFAGCVVFHFCDLHCTLSSLPHNPSPRTKFWGSVPHIPTYPPAPPMPSPSTPTPTKTSSALVTTLLFSLVQPLLDRFWGPYRSFELPVMFGRCLINTPTPLHCISSLTYCPCHRKNRPTGERFF